MSTFPRTISLEPRTMRQAGTIRRTLVVALQLAICAATALVFMPRVARATSADSTVIFGPSKVIKGSPNNLFTYEMDSFTADSIVGQRYVLEIWNSGCTAVTAVVDSQQWLGSLEVAVGTTQVLRAMDIGATGNHNITIGVNGLSGKYAWVRVVRVREPAFVVAAETLFVKNGASQYKYFTPPNVGETPYTMRVINGSPNGSNRTANATITLNGSSVLSTFSTGIATSSFNISPLTTGQNTVQVTNNGATNSRMKLKVVAMDNTPPGIVLTAPVAMQVLPVDDDHSVVPEPGGGGNGEEDPYSTAAFTSASVIAVSGRILDETPGAMTLCDVTPGHTETCRPVRPTSPQSTTFGDTISLPWLGGHLLRLQATNSAKHSTTIFQWVVRDTTRPQLFVTSPHDTTVTDALITISGSWSDSITTFLTVDGDTIDSGKAKTFSRPSSYALDYGMNRIVIRASDKAGNRTQLVRNVFRKLPTEPSPVDALVSAPAANVSVATQFYEDARFLFTGTSALQAGVDTTKFVPAMVSIVRGRVTARDFSALANVKVSILSHPEYGSAITRADGTYDLVVNGATRVVVRMQKQGFLEAQRAVTPTPNNFEMVDDVALVGLSQRCNAVNLVAGAIVQGRFASDDDGDRKLVLRFESGTHAKISTTGGDSATVDSIHLHVTEYTVGRQGPQSMPGALPPASAYTYCVDFTVDEAETIGHDTYPDLPAPDVVFTQPVKCYVENFLHDPIGMRMPNGFYERRRGEWSADDDGYVIEVLSNRDNTVTLDSKGNGQPDSDARLDSLGITPAERTMLAGMYRAHESFIRAVLHRFSNADLNKALAYINMTLPPIAIGQGRLVTNPCKIRGSIISCEDRTLGELVPINGSPVTLNYRSYRAPGDSGMRSVRIPIVGTTVPSGINRAIVRLEVCGLVYERVIPGPITTSTAPVEMTWSGKDAYGRLVSHSVLAQAMVGYDVTVSTAGGTGGKSLGDPSAAGTGLGPANGNRQVGRILWNRQSITLGPLSPASDRLGGWTLSCHHEFDPTGTGTVFLGDGDIIQGTDFTMRRLSSASNDCSASNPSQVDGLTVARPKLAYGPSGDLYVAGCYAIYRVRPDRSVVRIAGTGYAGTQVWSEGATAATHPFKNEITGLCCLADGRVCFSVSSYWTPSESVIGYVDSLGKLRKIIGGKTGSTVGGGDGQVSPSAWVGHVTDLAASPDGSIYVIDNYTLNYTAYYEDFCVRRIAPNGVINRFAGGGIGGGIDGLQDTVMVATKPYLRPQGLTVGRDGSVYIGDQNGVRRVAPDGMISTYARMTLATGQTRITALAMAPDGAIYCAGDNGDFNFNWQAGMWRIAPDGVAAYIGGNAGPFGRSADVKPYPMRGIALNSTSSLAISSAGVVMQGAIGGLCAVEPAFRSAFSDVISVPSRDGREVYTFACTGSNTGRHLYTRNALTGGTAWQFAYDGQGRLASATDIDAQSLTIQRNESGVPIGIVTPGNRRTKLICVGSFLSEVSDTLGRNRWQFVTQADGLLASATNPNGLTTSFAWGSDGRLEGEDYSDGGWKHLTHAISGSTRTTTITSADSAWDAVYSIRDSSTTTIREVVAGPQHALTRANADSVRTWMPSGAILSHWFATDPRFNRTSPIVRYSTMRLGNSDTTVSVGRQRAMTSGFDPPGTRGEWAEHDSLNGARAWRTQFNANNLVLQLRSPFGRLRTVTVDAAGRPLRDSIPGHVVRTYTYNGNGRLSQVAEGGRTLQFAYDARGRLQSMEDALGRDTEIAYDAADRAVSCTLTGGRVIEFTTDLAGNLTGVRPPGRPWHTFDYSSAGQMTTYHPPDAGDGDQPTQYAWDRDHRLRGTQRPDHNDLAIAYGPTGEVKSLTPLLMSGKLVVSDSSTTGLVAKIDSPDAVTLTYCYAAPLDTIESWSGMVAGSVSRTYNRDLQVTSDRVNGVSPATYAYDADGLLTRAGSMTVNRRSDNGLVESTVLGDVTTSFSYSSHGELWQQTVKYQGDVIYEATYARDSLGRITQEAGVTMGVERAIAYAYDSDSGFLRQVSDGTTVIRYAYDSNGNRDSTTSGDASVETTTDNQDRLIQVGYKSYSYTEAGDLASTLGTIAEHAAADTGRTRYSYSSLGALRQVALKGGDLVQYLTDGRGRRVARKLNGVFTQKWLYSDALGPVAELDGSGAVVTRFVYGTNPIVPNYMVKGGTTYVVVADVRGSVRLLVNTATGEVEQQLDYDAWGNVVGDSNPGLQPFGFAGGLCDEVTGLVRFGARDYESASGRWTTKDPGGFVAGDANLYAYCGNDPVNRIDPSGLFDMASPADWPMIPPAVGDGVTGFGDAFGAEVIRAVFGIEGGYDPCSRAYRNGRIAGFTFGMTQLALQGGAALGGTGIGRAMGLNRGRWFRIGPGRWYGDMVPRVSIGPSPGNAHFNLSARVPIVPPVGGPNATADCGCK